MDHINGKKRQYEFQFSFFKNYVISSRWSYNGHVCVVIVDQRNLGMSMKVERSSLDQVKKRFEMNKKKLEEKSKEYDFEQRMTELREEVCFHFRNSLISFSYQYIL